MGITLGSPAEDLSHVCLQAPGLPSVCHVEVKLVESSVIFEQIDVANAANVLGNHMPLGDRIVVTLDTGVQRELCGCETVLVYNLEGVILFSYIPCKEYIYDVRLNFDLRVEVRPGNSSLLRVVMLLSARP